MKRRDDLITNVRFWCCIALMTAIATCSFVTTNVKAGAYLDLGLSYVDEFGIIERAEVTFGDYTISAEASARLEVESFVGMVRLGYMFDNGLAFEYETKGVPDARLEFYNIYWRKEFN